MKNLFTGIIFFDPLSQIQPRKYRNISNVPNFLKFAKKSGGVYVNLYFKENKKFSHRESLTGAL